MKANEIRYAIDLMVNSKAIKVIARDKEGLRTFKC
jgi:hypothetical protein